MTYVNYTYYTETYEGISVSEDEFNGLELRAGEMIDGLTMYKVAQTSLNDYPIFIQEQFKKAVCAQIDYIYANGGMESLYQQEVQDISLGKFNYSTIPEKKSNTHISPLAYQYLLITGLLYRGMC